MVSFIAHATGSLSLADLHPVILHFPIVLITLAFIFDLLYAIGRVKTPYIVGHWLIIFAALTLIPTVITGLLAADIVGDDLPAVIIHRELAIATLTYTLLYATFRTYFLTTQKQLPVIYYLFLSFFNVALVSMTAEFGGIIAFGKGIIFDNP